MGNKRIGEGQMSKKARQHNKRKPINKMRRQQAIQQGKALARAGVKVGRKKIDAARIPNLDNYASLVRGMGYQVRLEDLRKAQKRRHSS